MCIKCVSVCVLFYESYMPNGNGNKKKLLKGKYDYCFQADEFTECEYLRTWI